MTDVGDNRAQFFASLRRRSPSPQPQSQPHTHSMQSDAAATQYQMAYLQLQQQMLMQQSQLLLATAAQQVILGHGRGLPQATPNLRNAQVHSLHPEEDVSRNPLAASAIARRKRQSLTLEPTPAQHQAADFNARSQGRRVSSGGQSFTSAGSGQQHQQMHHRRTSSGPLLPQGFAQGFAHEPRRTWSSTSTTSGDLPPALVLSKPGDPFLPPSPPASDEGAGSVTSWMSDAQESSLESSGSRRPSQAGSLAAALGRRKTSLNIEVPPVTTAIPSALTASAPSFQPQHQLSPFATTFQPLPPSPYTPTPTTAYGGAGAGASGPATPRLPTPPRTGGTGLAVATALRQPRGPASDAEFSSTNFAARLRKHAVACLAGRGARVTVSN